MRFFPSTIILFLLFALCNKAYCQGIAPELDKLLKETLDGQLTTLNTRSLSAAIQMSDGNVWAHAKGISSTLPKVDVTPDHVYLIGSVTKTITAACILQLQEEGLLNINDSLYQWLDTIQYINPNITIRQLLQHTSGLYDILSNPAHQTAMNLNISKIWSAEELIKKFIKPAISQAGTKWSYCNTNYFLLDMIIKKATGRKFYQEYRDRFFTPLQLSTFAIPSYEPMESPVAHVWLDTNGDGNTEDAHSYYISNNALNSTAGAAGGYYATPSDCSRWMRAYMRGDIVGEAMMNELKKTVNSTSQGGKYGLGIMKNTFLGYEAWGHGGDLGYHASSWYFPELDISISVFNNDGAKTSWDLLAVVRELLRTYTSNISLSTEAKNEEIQFKAYPNPFTDHIEVTIPEGPTGENITVELIDETGKTIYTKNVKNIPKSENIVRLNGLDKLTVGTYILNLSVDHVAQRPAMFLKI